MLSIIEGVMFYHFGSRSPISVRRPHSPQYFLNDGSLPATLKKIKANKYLNISNTEDNTKLVLYRITVMPLLEYCWNNS